MLKGIGAHIPQGLEETTQPSRRPGSAFRGAAAESSFENLLKERIEQKEIRFSRHAVDRMRSRDIRVTPEDVARISSAVERAAEKGAKDSLLVMEERAFIVSVENRTVITALDKDSLRENLVTNIDSAIVL